MNKYRNQSKESLEKNYSMSKWVLVMIGICLIFSIPYFDTGSIRNASPLIVCLVTLILSLIKTIKLKKEIENRNH